MLEFLLKQLLTFNTTAKRGMILKGEKEQCIKKKNLSRMICFRVIWIIC